MLNIEDLLENEEVKGALNMGQTYSDFVWHWDNYELTYVTGYSPTKKLWEKLLKAYKSEELPKNYCKPWLETCQEIVKERAYKKIWGQTVDLWTASMMVQIYDKLSDANKEKFRAMDFPIAHHVTMGIIAKSNEEKGA